MSRSKKVKARGKIREERKYTKMRKQKERGFLLVTTLLVATILMILGVSFIAITSQDYNFAYKELLNLQAYYLAKAGEEYYYNTKFPSSNVTLLSRDKNYNFEIKGEGSLVYITGIVLSKDGKILSKETLTFKKKGF